MASKHDERSAEELATLLPRDYRITVKWRDPQKPDEWSDRTLHIKPMGLRRAAAVGRPMRLIANSPFIVEGMTEHEVLTTIVLDHTEDVVEAIHQATGADPDWIGELPNTEIGRIAAVIFEANEHLFERELPALARTLGALVASLGPGAKSLPSSSPTASPIPAN